jgi:hypothetical protein
VKGDKHREMHRGNHDSQLCNHDQVQKDPSVVVQEEEAHLEAEEALLVVEEVGEAGAIEVLRRLRAI